jgi:hypothetical protein
MVESTRFVRVMTDMTNKGCNKKDTLVERRVCMRSESDPKISTGILENENGRGTRASGPRKRRGSARGRQMSACDKTVRS